MLSDDLTEKLIKFTQNVFHRMVSMDVEGEVFTGDISIPGCHLTAMVGFAGSVVGMAAVHSSERFGRMVAGAMLKSDGKDFAGVDIRDAMGEVTNVIAGQMKAHLSQCSDEENLVFEQSVPSVICGEQYEMYTVTKVPRICIRFTSEVEPFYVELALEKN